MFREKKLKLLDCVGFVQGFDFRCSIKKGGMFPSSLYEVRDFGSYAFLFLLLCTRR